MKRKITKNNHQYKVSLPVEILRKLNWSEDTSIKFHEVKTPLGKGMLIVKDTPNTAVKIKVKRK